MPLHQATLNYIGGVEPALEWETRGIRKKNKKRNIKLKKQRRQVDQFLNTKEGKEKLQSFLEECSMVYHNLLSDKEWISDYLENKKIIFVIGAMRTAGTYLYTELCKIMNINWENLNLKMTHDNIPTYAYLTYWEKPSSWLPLIFEMAQFLAWAKRECMGQEAIVQKRIAYGHAIPVLDNLFGDNAEYIITVRHPGAIAESFKELEDINMKTKKEPNGWKHFVEDRKGISKTEWEELSYNEMVLVYWQVYYEDVVKYGLPEGNITVLGYGQEEYEGFLKGFAQNRNKDYKPNEFKVSDRRYDDFWYSDQVKEVINQVELWWQIHGLEFPELELK